MKKDDQLIRCSFILILILAAAFRFYGLNWDQGQHLHPDERMITMVAEKIHLPKPLTLATILTPKSPLNPKFFPYGSLPIYLLKFSGFLASFLDSSYATYRNLNLVGRYLSVLFDLSTIIVIFKISQTLLPAIYSLLPSLFYALSVLSIQTSHFYVVDIPLTFFTSLTLYFLIKLVSKPSLKLSIFTGTAFGLSLASKISSILLIVPIFVALTLIFFQRKNLLAISYYLLATFIFSFFIFNLSMPYALIDFPTFHAHTLEQSRMTKSAFTFPYTLQYVGTTPYLYHLKNLFLWGMGMPLGVISIGGILFVTLSVLKSLVQWLHGSMATWLKKTRKKLSHSTIEQFNHLTILLSFFWVYFLVTGSFAVKFMRYLLPIYPLFCVFACLFLSQIVVCYHTRNSKLKSQSAIFEQSEKTSDEGRVKLQLKSQNSSKFLLFAICCLLFAILLWPLSLLSIYSRPHTRIEASKWIYKNIGQGSSLSVEHWDDQLPLPLTGFHSVRYDTEVLPLYDPDTEAKWQQINEKLAQTDYIVIASNRLYVPLMKLTDCQKLPPGRCYLKTAQYYQKLFNGTLGFSKVAEFTSYPTLDLTRFLPKRYFPSEIGIWNLEFRDEVADESFTVYDHPKVMIFKKNKD